MGKIKSLSNAGIISFFRIWWTLTGNFGNMPPLDFSKTQTRRLQLPALNLQPRKVRVPPYFFSSDLKYKRDHNSRNKTANYKLKAMYAF